MGRPVSKVEVGGEDVVDAFGDVDVALTAEQAQVGQLLTPLGNCNDPNLPPGGQGQLLAPLLRDTGGPLTSLVFVRCSWKADTSSVVVPLTLTSWPLGTVFRSNTEAASAPPALDTGQTLFIHV